jgi:hypothetical protein
MFDDPTGYPGQDLIDAPEDSAGSTYEDLASYEPGSEEETEFQTETEVELAEPETDYADVAAVAAEVEAEESLQALDALETIKTTIDHESAGAEIAEPEAEELGSVEVAAADILQQPTIGAIPATNDAPEQPSAELSDAASADAPLSNVQLSIDDFAALEERVLRAVGVVRQERQSRVAAEQRAETSEARAADLESQLATQTLIAEQVDQLQVEIDSLRAEREQVRLRVERLLGQLDALEL